MGPCMLLCSRAHTSSLVHDQLGMHDDASIVCPLPPCQEQDGQQRHEGHDSTARGPDAGFVDCLGECIKPCKSRFGRHIVCVGGCRRAARSLVRRLRPARVPREAKGLAQRSAEFCSAGSKGVAFKQARHNNNKGLGEAEQVNCPPLSQGTGRAGEGDCSGLTLPSWCRT